MVWPKAMGQQTLDPFVSAAVCSLSNSHTKILKNGCRGLPSFCYQTLNEVQHGCGTLRPGSQSASEFILVSFRSWHCADQSASGFGANAVHGDTNKPLSQSFSSYHLSGLHKCRDLILNRLSYCSLCSCRALQGRSQDKTWSTKLALSISRLTRQNHLCCCSGLASAPQEKKKKRGK